MTKIAQSGGVWRIAFRLFAPEAIAAGGGEPEDGHTGVEGGHERRRWGIETSLVGFLFLLSFFGGALLFISKKGAGYIVGGLKA